MTRFGFKQRDCIIHKNFYKFHGTTKKHFLQSVLHSILESSLIRAGTGPRHSMTVIRLLLWPALLVSFVDSSLSIAEQGSFRLSPRVERGKPVTIDAQNFSKLSIQVTKAKVNLGEGPCTVELSGPVKLGPAETKSIELAGAEIVGRCLSASGLAPTARLSLRPAEAPVADQAGRTDRPTISLEYTAEIQGRPVSESRRWHLLGE